jgi:hypothetical protein
MTIYDCALYHGQIEPLLERLDALHHRIDVFVVVEATLTADGQVKPLHLRRQWPAVRRFASKLRYIVVDDLARLSSRSARLSALEQAARRGLLDRSAGDTVHKEGFFEVLSARGPVPTAYPPPAPPVIVCPYVHDEDRVRVAEAFGLHRPAGAQLPFFFWQDRELIGPERAFEHCWRQFPTRDIVIVHTDMRPMPDDRDNGWFRALCRHAEKLPGAAMIACDLLYPLKSPQGRWYVQCAGGHFDGQAIGHIGGGVNVEQQTAEAGAHEYDDRFAAVRPAQWVTFGGVYIRREALDMVGSFDSRYEWAYVMDVDYCLEGSRRGLRMCQVPVNLLHEESGTSRRFLELPEYQQKIGANLRRFQDKWGRQLAQGDLQGPARGRIPDKRTECEAST